jgi:hypothetical protein
MGWSITMAFHKIACQSKSDSSQKTIGCYQGGRDHSAYGIKQANVTMYYRRVGAQVMDEFGV